MLRNLIIIVKFYLFLLKRGVLKEYISACKDSSYDSKYVGVMKILKRGTSPMSLILHSFSFARQMYVNHSNTDWHTISKEWTEYINEK